MAVSISATVLMRRKLAGLRQRQARRWLVAGPAFLSVGIPRPFPIGQRLELCAASDAASLTRPLWFVAGWTDVVATWHVPQPISDSFAKYHPADIDENKHSQCSDQICMPRPRLVVEQHSESKKRTQHQRRDG